MIKLTSSTGNTTIEINPDRNALIFKSKSCEAGVYWPMKDWDDLKSYVDALRNEGSL